MLTSLPHARRWCRRFNLFALLAVTCLVSPAWAQPASPVPVLETTAHTLLNALSTRKAYYAAHPEALPRLVERVVLPRVDVPAMAESVVGPPWRRASMAQRDAFKTLFLRLVVNTYAAALTTTSQQTVVFRPIRGPIQGAYLRVVSSVSADGKPPVAMVYQMHRVRDAWKIIDFSVDGISLVESYRAQFASTLQQGGMRALLQQLKARQGHGH